MTARVLKLGVAVAATGAALMLGAGSASAATTYTVTAGSAPSGTRVAITGVTQGASPQIAFNDATTGTQLNCVSGSAPGVTTTGAGRAGARIGTITGAGTKWNGCTGPLGLQFVVTGSGSWLINATTATRTGFNGTISNVSAVVDGGSSCKFTVTGSVPIKVTNSTQTLQVLDSRSTLTVSNLTGGCFGAVNNGDKANFAGTYKLTANNAAYNPLKIVGVTA